MTHLSNILAKWCATLDEIGVTRMIIHGLVFDARNLEMIPKFHFPLSSSRPKSSRTECLANLTSNTENGPDVKDELILVPLEVGATKGSNCLTADAMVWLFPENLGPMTIGQRFLEILLVKSLVKSASGSIVTWSRVTAGASLKGSLEILFR